MTEYEWPIVLLVFILTHIWAQHVAYRERRELYDRLRSGTLKDYVITKDLADPADKVQIVREKPQPEDRTLEDDFGYLTMADPMPEDSIAKGMAATRQLLGE